MISKIVNDFRNCLDCLYVTRGIPDKNVIILNDVKRHITILGLYKRYYFKVDQGARCFGTGNKVFHTIRYF